jgi:hypothetical protein
MREDQLSSSSTMEYALPNSYQNKQERDVHVWAAERSFPNDYLVLIAGLSFFAFYAVGDEDFYQVAGHLTS